MSKDELIAIQALRLEEIKLRDEQNKRLIDRIKSKFCSVGAPLNDNKLKFNREQIMWCAQVMDMIEEIEID